MGCHGWVDGCKQGGQMVVNRGVQMDVGRVGGWMWAGWVEGCGHGG